MDPNATLARIQDAISEVDKATADTLCEDLQLWIVRGGFSPDWDKYPKAYKYFSQWEKRPVKTIRNAYSVIVGNIGTVYSGSSRLFALRAFNTYRQQSIDKYGRAAGEDVTMFTGEEISAEHLGTLHTREFHCDECGGVMFIGHAGITHHGTPDSINWDLDREHTPYTTEDR